ncbi:MAG: 2-C-methyl-D-erythritol 2,4-cyclodiphosphate synthase [Muribaculaceae bacterium]|nr:2-C-methyl-D-erythritol 2,4-cyclodiphosphate synthase [Muribaculaceae bacterium]
MDIRVGNGIDVHKLVEGRELWLCGIKFDYPLGLLGHSDADVAIHALCDALLGAAALRDIGYHFPDTDPKYKGIDSRKLLSHVVSLLTENGWKIGNVDITICAEQPKMKPFIPKMQLEMSKCMGVEPNRVSVKATTTEHLGFTGRGKGIMAYASALIYK